MMFDNNDAETPFRKRDEVVLDKGTYQGTPGVFLRYRGDRNWADIQESDGSVRMHPVVWLARPWPKH